MYSSMILLISFSELYIHHDNRVWEQFYNYPQIPTSPSEVNLCFFPAPGTTDLPFVSKFAFLDTWW